jgi:DNA processing protein
VHRLREAKRPAAMDALLRAMDRYGIRLVTRESPDYPPLLRFLEDAPFALFVRGEGDLTSPRTFAMVGSRRCTRYGEQAAKRIAAGLAEAGVTVVSGMARGIDTASHEGCLAVGGRTWAVLGCGADIAYPPENEGLIARVIETGGAVITEYPPGMPPLAAHFPVRNRILSGLCSGMLIVEAGVRSGAMITVRCALAQGREVYALPGPVDSPVSEMPLTLLREGGQMATCAEDILGSLRWLGDGEGASSEMDAAPPPPSFANNRASGSMTSAAKANKASSEMDAAPPPPPPLPPGLLRVVEALRGEETGFSEIVARTGFSVPDVNSYLTMLELQGIIVQLPGRIYASVR